MLQTENLLSCLHSRGGSHDNRCLYNLFLDGVQFTDVFQHSFQEMVTESRITRCLASYAQIVESCLCQHCADFIHGTIGIGHEENTFGRYCRVGR